ncbi:MAG: amidohydrolase family protein, partial [Leptolyngbya sp. SIO3F4]|nr:amidohydrolase family protein [Leptolyngbya sp. SIO3F4]
TVAHIPKGNATGGTMAPTPILRTAGANLALGTDNMHADMVEVMRWALAIARLQIGHVSDDWQPHHVFTMATLAGAEAMGLADQIGSLRAGKKADLVAFNFQRPHLTPCVNPLGNLVHTGQGRDVALVVVNGQVVVQAGEATQVDETEIRTEAAKAAQQLWQRCS